MKMKASVGRHRKRDLREFVWKIEYEAETEAEAAVLARLYREFVQMVANEDNQGESE